MITGEVICVSINHTRFLTYARNMGCVFCQTSPYSHLHWPRHFHFSCGPCVWPVQTDFYVLKLSGAAK